MMRRGSLETFRRIWTSHRMLLERLRCTYSSRTADLSHQLTIVTMQAIILEHQRQAATARAEEEQAMRNFTSRTAEELREMICPHLHDLHAQLHASQRDVQVAEVCRLLWSGTRAQG